MRKLFHHNTVVELCTSIQDGLPLVATKFMEVIIEGILGAAAFHYPVTIVGHVVMRNHLHMLIVVQDPAQFPSFVGYLKTELAHAVNSLLGRKKHTVWEPDFDSPVILTPEKMLERLRYLYLNPARANLVRSIRKYAGLSTFSHAQANTAKRSFTKRVKKVSRDAIPTLPKRVLSLKEQERLARELLKGRGVEYTLKIDPWAWINCFPETSGSDPKLYQELFLDSFFKEERDVVADQKFSPPTPEQLRLKDPRERYESKRDGRKMICLSSDVELRCSYIAWYKKQAKLAKEILRGWRLGDFSVKPPPGFFLPGGALLTCALFPIL